MKIVEDVRKTVSNPKPLYFAAGVGDAAVEALKDAPARLTAASAKAGDKATEVVGKVAGAAESVQSRIALAQIDPKAIRGRITEPDLRAVREKTQNLVLAQVGRALEAAGKAVEAYDGYSERGKVVVERVLSGRSGTDVQVVSVDETAAKKPAAETVVVDEVVVIGDFKANGVPKTDGAPTAKPEAEVDAQQVQTPEAADGSVAEKPAAPRRAPAARKKPTNTK